ncbi:NAD(P)-dependent oxidoreductase [Salipiger abyssi]|uniref:NAD(P)-dependent oxidoreductase n=1 Tax=Salipiger abyssi TaxID=1250539 RepID=UPI00405A1D37
MPGPVIVNHLSAEVGEALSQHPSGPTVIARPGAERPWEIPQEAEILLTGAFEAWKQAPDIGPDLPNLRWVQTFSAGVEGYPDWLKQGRLVSCGRGLTSGAIAEYVMAAMLRVEKPLDTRRVRCRDDWRDVPLGGLDGKRLGLLGYGSIGQAIARRAAAFGMEVLALRRGGWDESEPHARPAASAGALIGAVDYLVVATPLTPQTEGMVNAALLSQARPGLHLINISRGRIVDQEALLAALDAGTLSGATLDVTTPEPLPDGHPLLARDDVLITPHISYTGGAARARFIEKLLANLDAYLAGTPLRDVVEPGRGY